MRRAPLVAASVAALSLLVAHAPEAHARTVSESRYGFDVAWNAAIRLIRVDLGFTIVERDRETGFLLFTYRDTNNRESPGSLELVPATVDGTQGVRVIVQLAQMPSYMERMLANQLDRKLHAEYGEPQPPNTGRREPTPPGIGTVREPDRAREAERDRDRDRAREGDRDRARETERPREGNGEGARVIVRPSEPEQPRNPNGE